MEAEFDKVTELLSEMGMNVQEPELNRSLRTVIAEAYCSIEYKLSILATVDTVPEIDDNLIKVRNALIKNAVYVLDDDPERLRGILLSLMEWGINMIRMKTDYLLTKE